MSKIVPDYLQGFKLIPDDDSERVCNGARTITSTSTQMTEEIRSHRLSDQTIKDIDKAFKALEILEGVTEECRYSFSAKFEYNGRKFEIRDIGVEE